MRIEGSKGVATGGVNRQILDDESLVPARHVQVPRGTVVFLNVQDHADPFNRFNEAVENDPTLTVKNENGKLSVDIFGCGYEHGEIDGPNKYRVTALEFSPIAQRYHVQTTYGGRPDVDFLVNVDRASKTANVLQRKHDGQKWSAWAFVGEFNGNPPVID